MSSGGRVFPSITGGGLTSAAQAFLDQQIANRAASQRDRQIDIAEQAQRLNQLTVLSDLLPPGTTLGSLGSAGMDMFGGAFGIDPAGLEDLQLNRETFESALDQRRIGLLDDPDFADLLLPSTRAALGLEPSEDVSDARDLEAQMRFNSLTDILRDPALTSEFTARALGREPISLQIPGVEGTVDFDSTTAANIYAQFLLQREQFGLRLRLEGEDPKSQLIEEVKKAVELAGHSVSSTSLQSVFQIYNRAVSNQNMAPLVEFLNNPQTSEGQRLAAQFLVGSIRVGEEAFIDNLPPQLANFVRIGITLSEFLPAELVSSVMQNITQALSEDFTAQLKDPFFGGLEVRVGGRVIGEDNPLQSGGRVRQGPSGDLDLNQVPDNILVEEARAALADGSATREQLIGLIGEELVNQASPPIDPDVAAAAQIPQGGLNPDSVPPAFRADVQRLNTLIRQRDRTTGEAQKRTIQNVIDRLQERIRAGVSGG